MAYDGSLTFDTAIDTAGFNKGTTSLSKQANGLKGTFSKLGKVIGTTFVVTQLVKFGKQAVELASDIQEVQNVVDTAFGDMKYKMEAFAETAIEVYGISKLTAKQTGSTFMAMASGMGLMNETASDMALQLTALSADMASFYNKTQDVTSTALKSVFTGETETLKQFGIVMTEANLETFRLSQGIEKSYKAMSQAEKVALRYNYVMQQTRLSQGDFAKTQDSWANQTRILSERWKEFLGILGNGLVKVLTPLVKVLNTVLQYLISFASTIAQLLGAEAEQQETVSSAIGDSVDNQEALTKATEDTAKANKKTLASFDEIQKLTSSNDSSNNSETNGGVNFDVATPYEFDFNTQTMELNLENIYSKLGTIKDYISQFKNPFENWINNDLIIFFEQLSQTSGITLNGIFETFKMVFEGITTNIITPFINTLFTYILPFWTQFSTQMLKTWEVLFTNVKKIFDTVWRQGIEPAFSLISSIWNSAWASIKSAWDKWGSPIFENVRLAITNIGNTFQLMWDTYLKPIWDNFMNTIDWLWLNHLKPLWDNFLDFVGELINGALEIYNKFIMPIVNWLVKTFGPTFKNVFNLIVNIVGTVVGTITDIISGIITSLKGIVEFIVGVFTGNWEKAWQGICDFFGGIWEGIVGIVKGAINLVIDFINGMIAGIETALNWIVEKINSLEITNPFTGDEIWSPNISKFAFGRIPKLATGTVVPANYGEFTAILGDNKRETEVVSPLSTMKQALIEALAESGQNITIKFEETSIGDLVRLLKPYIDKENRRIGSTTRVTGGAY